MSISIYADKTTKENMTLTEFMGDSTALVYLCNKMDDIFSKRIPSENLDKLIEEGKIEYAEQYVSLEKEAKQWEREKTQQQQ